MIVNFQFILQISNIDIIAHLIILVLVRWVLYFVYKSFNIEKVLVVIMISLHSNCILQL